MSKRIVDLFKIIQVKHDEGQRVLISKRGLEFARGKFKEVSMIAQAGQAIGICQLFFALQRLLEFEQGCFAILFGASQFLFRLLASVDIMCHPQRAVCIQWRDVRLKPYGSAIDNKFVLDLCVLFCIQNLLYDLARGLSLFSGEDILLILTEQFLRRLYQQARIGWGNLAVNSLPVNNYHSVLHRGEQSAQFRLRSSQCFFDPLAFGDIG